MSDIERAIKHFKSLQKRYTTQHNGKQCKLVETALEALSNELKRNQGCKYCNGTEAEYQHTCNTKISINTLGKARTIVTECNPCPPCASCSMKNIPARATFIINYCPNCGRKLENDSVGGKGVICK